MKTNNLKKIGRALFNGFASSINLNEARTFTPRHHEYGKQALTHDFGRVGTDIYTSMDNIKDHKSGRNKVNLTSDGTRKVTTE